MRSFDAKPAPAQAILRGPTPAVAAASAPLSPSPTGRADASEGDGHGYSPSHHQTVLVVDDDSLNRFLMIEALGPDGYRMEEAASGEEALQAFARVAPSLILLDIDMPGMDGLAVCRTLRDLPGGALVPIVMVTGLDENGIIDEAFDAGATDFLTKPFNWRLVRQRVRFLLRHAAINRSLQENERILEQVQRMVQVGHWRWDMTTGKATVSAVAHAILPERPDTYLRHFDGTAPNDPFISLIYHDLQESVAQGAVDFAREYEFELPGQGPRRIAIHAQITYDADGAPSLILGATQDITALTEQQARLRQADICIRNSNDGIALISHEGRIVTANPAFEAITGFSIAELTAMAGDMLRTDGRLHPDALAAINQGLMTNGVWRGEVDYRHPAGASVPLMLSISAVKNEKGAFSGNVVIMTDNSQLRASEQRLFHLAHHDPLTQLPNRLSLQERLHSELADSSLQCPLTLLYIDLDGFKLVNDSLGHTSGDTLLREVAQRLQAACEPTDLLTRIGGDEFALVLFGRRSREAVLSQGQRLLESLQLPFQVQGRAIFIGASIGACRYPEDAGNAVDILRNADTAMYEAKRLGRGQLCFWSRELTTLSARRLAIESELRSAIGANELFLHYQPKFAAESGAIIGVEALVRWRSPTRGVIPPGDFIPVAEESGLVIALGEWVIQEACRQVAWWRDQDGFTLPVAVNISALHLRQPSLLATVREALARHALAPRLLEIEITEESLGFRNDAEAPVDIMNALSELGLTIAIDDFGTGYSSLSQLKQLPIRTLKIDRSFVTDLDASTSDQAIIKAIVQLGKTLGMQIVAEGVETEEQAMQLRALRCDVLQGFLYSRPVDAEAIRTLLGVAT